MKVHCFITYISFAITFFLTQEVRSQCTLTNATGCVCRTNGQTNCDLLPDITISWKALQDYAGGPSEYAQNDPNDPGRLRVTGSTPNIGYGPLNVRGVDQNGYRWFLCGSDTLSIYDPNSTNDFTNPACPDMKQLILQRIYHKNGGTMSYTEHFAGTMTYHPTHGHNHVDDWATFTLRAEIPGETNPLNWPIVGEGAKVGFCLMDYYSCSNSSASGHCRTDQSYNSGTALNSNSAFPNYGLGGGSYNCSQVSQGISVGWTDVYSENLDGMWINIPPGTCNGNYWVVMEVDPRNNFVEENENNNWTAIPVTLTQQVPAGGDFATISSDQGTVACANAPMQLTATLGTTYLWNNGATTRTISPTASGTYSCTVTGTCGTDTTPPFTVSLISANSPTGTGATLSAPGVATLQATGANVSWFNTPTGGTMLASGNSYTTPYLSTTTSFWAQNEATNSNSPVYVGMATNGSGTYNTLDQYLAFNASAPFILKSVKVYAASAGNRTFQILNSGGGLIEQTTVYVPSGEQRVQLDLNVPVGSNMRLKLTTAFIDLHRSANGVNYPYTVPDVVSITGSSAGASYYYYCYDWEVQKEPLTCASARTEVIATVQNGFVLNAKVILEGPYVQATGLMSDGLRTSGLVPTTEPYTALGYSHFGGGGGESITNPSLLGVTGNSAIVDWVLVELRSPAQPSTIIATHSALLLCNSSIVSANGEELRFSVPQGNYYVAIRHRNHLGVMTATPVSFGNSAVSVDLTNLATATYGTAARKTVGTKGVLHAGNVRNDHALMYTGSNNDRDPILSQIGGTVPTNTVTTYHITDVNMDGVVRYTGTNNDRDYILSNIGGLVPTQVKLEQLP